MALKYNVACGLLWSLWFTVGYISSASPYFVYQTAHADFGGSPHDCITEYVASLTRYDVAANKEGSC